MITYVNSCVHSVCFLFLLMLGCSTQGLFAQQKTLNPKFEKRIEQLIDHTVPVITCERLEQKLNIPNLVILDAREPEEYATSHIKGAQWIGYNTFASKNVKSVDKDAIVVVYCSVGYRSEKIGEQLKKMGYERVYNLYGGIFEWTNRNLPLVNKDEQPTQQVHAYDKNWGQWLDRGEKVYVK